MVPSILQSEVNVVKEILIKEIKAVQELLEIRLSQTALQEAESSSDASGSSQKGSKSSLTKTKKKWGLQNGLQTFKLIYFFFF